jgi:uncharacterized protein YuzE
MEEESVRSHYEGRLRISYNREGDVLYISLGEPREALTVPEAEGLLVRVDPETKEVVGATITDYEEHFRHLPEKSLLAMTALLPPDLQDFCKRRPSL